MHTPAVLRCFLILCLWQGPLPVWHAHGTLPDAPEASRAWLAKHLETHHASVDPCDVVCFGWHLHFEVPHSEGDPDDVPSPSLRDPVVIATNGDGGRLPGGGELPFVTTDAPYPLAHRPLVESARSPRSARRGFFPDDAASLPLPLRIGVARC